MYSDNHKQFVQYMLQNPCVNTEKSVEILIKIVQADHTSLEDVLTYLAVINKEIQRFDLQVIQSKCEVTGEDFFILINTANDNINKLQTEYTLLQLEYFQAVVKEILSLDEKRATPIFCMNLSSSLSTSFSISNAEKLLDKWVAQKYLISHDSHIYLGPRYLVEFSAYLRTLLNHCVFICELCSELLVIGSRCSSCNKIFHCHCISDFVQRKPNCPECKRPWKEALQQSQLPQTSQQSQTSCSSEDTDDDD